MSSLMHPVFILVLALGVLVFLAQADNAFCGCQNSLTSSYVTMSPPTGQNTFASATQCQQACFVATNPTPAVVGRTNYRHSMFRATDGTCLCTDKYPSVAYQSNGMPDTCSNPAHWDNRIVQTTFIKYPNCYAGTPAGIVMTGIAGPDSCSIKCATSLNMVFWMNAAGGNFQCGCGTVNQFPAIANICGPNTYFIYYHTVAQASQGLSRRKHREQLIVQAKPVTLCPKKLTACRIESDQEPDVLRTSAESFECIDTKRDIDSCGGCLHGTILQPHAPIGQDCYSFGAAMGAATCYNGRCQVTRCKPAYHLVDGHCIKKKGRRMSSKL